MIPVILNNIKAYFHRAKPVINIRRTLTITPDKINFKKENCDQRSWLVLLEHICNYIKFINIYGKKFIVVLNMSFFNHSAESLSGAVFPTPHILPATSQA